MSGNERFGSVGAPCGAQGGYRQLGQSHSAVPGRGTASRRGKEGRPPQIFVYCRLLSDFWVLARVFLVALTARGKDSRRRSGYTSQIPTTRATLNGYVWSFRFRQLAGPAGECPWKK